MNMKSSFIVSAEMFAVARSNSCDGHFEEVGDAQCMFRCYSDGSYLEISILDFDFIRSQSSM